MLNNAADNTTEEQDQALARANSLSQVLGSELLPYLSDQDLRMLAMATCLPTTASKGSQTLLTEAGLTAGTGQDAYNKLFKQTGRVAEQEQFKVLCDVLQNPQELRSNHNYWKELLDKYLSSVPSDSQNRTLALACMGIISISQVLESYDVEAYQEDIRSHAPCNLHSELLRYLHAQHHGLDEIINSCMKLIKKELADATNKGELDYATFYMLTKIQAPWAQKSFKQALETYIKNKNITIEDKHPVICDIAPLLNETLFNNTVKQLHNLYGPAAEKTIAVLANAFDNESLKQRAFHKLCDVLRSPPHTGTCRALLNGMRHSMAMEEAQYAILFLRETLKYFGIARARDTLQILQKASIDLADLVRQGHIKDAKHLDFITKRLQENIDNPKIKDSYKEYSAQALASIAQHLGQNGTGQTLCQQSFDRAMQLFNPSRNSGLFGKSRIPANQKIKNSVKEFNTAESVNGHYYQTLCRKNKRAIAKNFVGILSQEELTVKDMDNVLKCQALREAVDNCLFQQIVKTQVANQKFIKNACAILERMPEKDFETDYPQTLTSLARQPNLSHDIVQKFEARMQAIEESSTTQATVVRVV